MRTSIQSLTCQLPALSRAIGFASVPMPRHVLAIIGLAMAVAPTRAADLPALLPMPVSVTLTGGQFTITSATKVLHTKGDARLADAAAYLAQRLSQAFDHNVVAEATDASKEQTGAILMTTAGADPALGAEGYELAVTAQGAVIRAPQAAGAFYGGITLLQLVPAAAFRGQALVEDKLGGTLTKPAPRPCDEPNISRKPKPVDALVVPCATIADQPRFAWRGLLIDMARHFWTINELKAYVDYLAIHKLNSLQLHLTDHQNWCVEIMKYPSLTPEKALNAADPQRLANQTYDSLARHYYTQEELRDLVAYAAKRFVNIVPEIEMPGHCTALMRAGLNIECTLDGKPALGRGELCPGNDNTFVVLQNILDEVLAVFPGKYIHMGGDECGTGTWEKCSGCRKRMENESLKNTTELHGYFVGRMSDYIQNKGRTLVGWDEILESGAKTGAIGMYWRSGQADKLVASAAQNGQHLVMTPTAHCYFDYVQSPDKQSEPEGFGGNAITLKTAYELNPIPAEVAKVDPKLSLGVQANLWGERMQSFPHVLYMTYPRACALAEVAWSPDGPRDYAGFFKRVQTQCKRLDAAGINYRQPTATDQP